jgi:D-tyrosyl-tRNA(Tyr) deacylase
MKIIVQRAKSAKVLRRAQDKSLEVVGEIGKGFLVLVGFKKGDTKETVELLADKLFKLRVMSDKADKMNLSINDSGGSMLVVSQFTLYADTTGGNRPSFINAEEPAKAESLYKLFILKLREKGVAVETGSFGDYMQIDAVLDGPVTVSYEN